jgi:hypothetical protein
MISFYVKSQIDALFTIDAFAGFGRLIQHFVISSPFFPIISLSCPATIPSKRFPRLRFFSPFLEGEQARSARGVPPWQSPMTAAKP